MSHTRLVGFSGNNSLRIYEKDTRTVLVLAVLSQRRKFLVSYCYELLLYLVERMPGQQRAA